MGLGKTLTMISLVLKQRHEEGKDADADGTKSTQSSWLSAAQKGAFGSSEVEFQVQAIRSF